MVKLRRNATLPPPPGCALHQCLELISGAWTPNIIWYLRSGGRRFKELQTDLPGVSAKMLTARLRRLESLGVLIRTPQPTSPPTVCYSLSPLGHELAGALTEIVKVGQRLKLTREGAFQTISPA